MVRPYWHRQIPAVEIPIQVRSLRIIDFKYPAPRQRSFEDKPLASLTPPIRYEVTDASDHTHSYDSPDVDGIRDAFVYSEQPNTTISNRTIEIHPDAHASQYPNNSVFILPTIEQNFETEIRLPDFPDTEKRRWTGNAKAELYDWRPVPPPSTPSGTSYVHIPYGGNHDADYQLKVAVVQGAIQYIGPNKISERPLKLKVTVLPPVTPNEEMVETKFIFKVRTTPFNSDIDDPSGSHGAGSSPPGKISAYNMPQGWWLDQIEKTVSNQIGDHFIEVYFRTNERNFDHHIEVSTMVTKKTIHPGLPDDIHAPVTSGILIRGAILRPRLYFTHHVSGNYYEPITESGIIPITLQGRDGSIPALPNDAKFLLNCDVITLGLLFSVSYKQMGHQRI